MKRSALLVGAIGIALACGLVLTADRAAIAKALAAVGWSGAASLALYRLAPILLCAWAWQVLIPRDAGISVSACLRARLGRDGVGGLLPVMPAGGEIVGARMLALAGLKPVVAAATTIADVSLETASQAAFTLLGVAALVIAGTAAGSGDFRRWAMAGIALPLAMAAGLMAAQHPRVLGWLEALAGRLIADKVWSDWAGEGGLRPAFAGIYGRRSALAAGFGLHLAAWLIGIGEAWLALRLIGRPLPLLSVLGLEAVVFAVRSAAFVVPWAAGVQEGGYLALGMVLGLPPETALTLSLVKRIPEVLVGIPGLILWQRGERAPLLHRSSAQ